ncbi:hypothetical protein [Flavobacterium faecale]|uniref:hypothetical protein n=1 Tax=Flavobacterium faecale TaxID=1355330 RepID=UPI00131F2FE7|nr:hypothetical protein [Flavobacterium faecale]
MKNITYKMCKEKLCKKNIPRIPKIPSPDSSGALFKLAFFGKIKKAGTPRSVGGWK